MGRGDLVAESRGNRQVWRHGAAHHVGHLPDDIHSGEHSTEYDVLAVQIRQLR